MFSFQMFFKKLKKNICFEVSLLTHHLDIFVTSVDEIVLGYIYDVYHLHVLSLVELYNGYMNFKLFLYLIKCDFMSLCYKNIFFVIVVIMNVMLQTF